MQRKNKPFEIRGLCFWSLLALFVWYSPSCIGAQIHYQSPQSVPTKSFLNQRLSQRPPLTQRPTPIDSTRLQAPRPSAYLLDSGDVLGVFVEGVLGKVNEMPPVHYPEPGSDVGPSIGYPIVVRQDGTVSLPLVQAIPVRGMTVIQAEDLIKKRFLESEIVNEQNRIMVSLMRKRTVGVIVIRGDQSNSRFAAGSRGTSSRAVNARSDFSQRVERLRLPVGDNDLMNALALTGGLPGLNAKDNIRVYRGGTTPSPVQRSYSQNEFALNEFQQNQPSPFPRSRTNRSGNYQPTNGTYDSIGRSFLSRSRQLSQLKDGDIVVIDPKPTEVFYTGGLLNGNEYPIPRDRPLDILEAVALAGGNQVNRSGIGPVPMIQPTELTVLRKQPNGSQLNFRIDMNEAYRNPAQRLTVQPGDYLILRHSPQQQIGNIGIGTFNTYGVRQIIGR